MKRRNTAPALGNCRAEATASAAAFFSRPGRALKPWLMMLCCLLLAVSYAQMTVADPVWKRGYDNHSRSLPKSRDARGHKAPTMTMSEAIAIAESRSNGRVLRARQSVNERGETVYIIKVLTDKGVVRNVHINGSR